MATSKPEFSEMSDDDWQKIRDETRAEHANDDASPEDDYEYSCEVCGKEIFYGGKGRHPKRCDEHKKGPARKAATRPGMGTGKNGTLARQAAAALSQVNGLIGIALLLAPGKLKMPETATALAIADEGFSEQAYLALLTDPKLCALILKGGMASGRAALLIAYGMLAGAVVPVGIAEYRAYDADRS
jgi:hypothetical protein